MTIKHEAEVQQMVREINGMQIFIESKKTIIVFCNGYSPILFERWVEPKGFYARSWKPFREGLLRRQLRTLQDVRLLALKYGITSHSSRLTSIPGDVKRIMG